MLIKYCYKQCNLHFVYNCLLANWFHVPQTSIVCDRNWILSCKCRNLYVLSCLCEVHLHTNTYCRDWCRLADNIWDNQKLNFVEERYSVISHFVSPTRVFYNKSRINYFLHVSLLYRFLPPVNLNLSASVLKGKQFQCAVQT